MKRLPLPSTAELDRQELVNRHFKETSSYWKCVYERHDLGANFFQARAAAVLAMVDSLHLPSGAKVLEVGCGAGLTSRALAQRGYQVQSIDIVPAMIEQARQMLRGMALIGAVCTSLGDIRHLAFADDSFDLVLAVGVLAWVGSSAEPLCEMLRVAKPGAHLITTIANRWRLPHVLDPRCFPALRSFRWKVRSLLGGLGLFDLTVKPRPAVISIKAFDALLKAVGAEKVRGATLGFGPFTFFNFRVFPDSLGIRIDHQLQALADRGTFGLRSTGASYIVLARKP